MIRTFAAIVAFAALIGTGNANAKSSDPQPGEWSRETRPIGNKLTVEVYRRVRYAIPGDAVRQGRAEASDGRKHETRQIGNKLTIDVYHH